MKTNRTKDGATDPAALEEGQSNPVSPRRLKRKPLVIGVAALAVASAVAVTAFLASPHPVVESKKEVKVSTADVVRGDLVEQARVNGKLGYGEIRELGTNLDGTVTGLPPAGSSIGFGGELFRVDDRPVVLLHGELPMWRPFTTGMEDGSDILQLERNLKDLGYFTSEPDRKFRSNTATAIEKWQKAIGLDKNGTIEIGRIVFAPNEVRIAELKTSIGSAAGPEMVGVTTTTQQISASVDLNLSTIMTPGSELTVVLPNGTEAKGKIESIGTPVEQEDKVSDDKKPKLPLTILLDDPALAEGLDNVSVSMNIARVLRENALQVPVLALFAQTGGGFAVEVAHGKTSKMVSVELGIFANGMVEVTSGKLTVGDQIVVGK